ncbi:conserved hypothetical protein [Candidatus Desulfarcum epimagneticum]|uniref:KTSC domain-containing protein n=1 Tax=uncultured Desulfobacteraceae bacterium TaxID=218296 RepID=A0A484HHX6_9BACT|nr:conserved hypothetical protein [uncultured Desulfobacteraceae bacterium]
MMKKYANLRGKSGVDEYLITPTSIKIKFIKNPSVYVYNEMKPGRSHVSAMQGLALAGGGLGKYINRNIKGNYYSVE